RDLAVAVEVRHGRRRRRRGRRRHRAAAAARDGEERGQEEGALDHATEAILRQVSPFAIVLLVAAVVLVAAAEWPRLSGRLGVEGRQRRDRRDRRRRKSKLRVVSSESDDFAASVERDLAALPTIDEQDAKKR